MPRRAKTVRAQTSPAGAWGLPLPSVSVTDVSEALIETGFVKALQERTALPVPAGGAVTTDAVARAPRVVLPAPGPRAGVFAAPGVTPESCCVPLIPFWALVTPASTLSLCRLAVISRLPSA